MHSSPSTGHIALAQALAAPQHSPRPLPLFLDILWRETQGDPELRRAAFTGLRKYQNAQRLPPPVVPHCAARAGEARLLRYGAENGRFPVVFIPSLINPPHILDLSENRSMLRHMAASGHDPYLVDWGTPVVADASVGLEGHVTDRLLPLLSTLPRPPILVGYCLGGTLAIAASMLRNVSALVTLASPWFFNGFPETDRQEVAALWRGAKPLCERLGYVPMEVLQSGFWAIDPARTIRKYAAFAAMAEGSDEARAFLAVEDWSNAGPPLTAAAGRDVFEQLYAGDLTGRGEWRVGGVMADPAALACPTLSIRSMTDRIVPADAAPPLKEEWDLTPGHVGMIVGGKAPDLLWTPLSHWLSSHGG